MAISWRMLWQLALYILGAVALLGFALAMFLLLATGNAHASTCASRPGISHGKIWWRWRYAESGARCWYPGRRISRSRLANSARRSVTYAALRFRPRIKPPQTEAKKLTAPVEIEPPQTRTQKVSTSELPIEPTLEPRRVRIVPIINGRTVNMRVERAFEQFIIMPAEDDDK